jgi:hypothetical protein
MSGTSFVALYRGRTISTARLVAVGADRRLAAEVAARMRCQPLPSDDGIVTELERGRHAALRLIEEEEVGDAPDD